VAFFGFPRCGEFTCNRSFDPTINLCPTKVVCLDDHALLTLNTSKTDPFRNGVVISLFNTEHTLNPFQYIKQYCQFRQSEGDAPSDPLFVTQLKVPLDRNTIPQLLRQVLQYVGLDSSCYNGHSFLIGAATSCAEACIEDHLIKTLGRWSSDCYTRKIRTPTSAIQATQKALAIGKCSYFDLLP
jgi:hypothetical protein